MRVPTSNNVSLELLSIVFYRSAGISFLRSDARLIKERPRCRRPLEGDYDSRKYAGAAVENNDRKVDDDQKRNIGIVGVRHYRDGALITRRLAVNSARLPGNTVDRRRGGRRGMAGGDGSSLLHGHSSVPILRNAKKRREEKEEGHCYRERNGKRRCYERVKIQ